MRADGEGAPETVPGTSRIDYPSSVTADESAILVTRISSTTAGDVVLVPVKGGEPRVLVSTPAYEGGPQLSPDEKWVIYSSNLSGRMEVYLRRIDGPERYPVSTAGGVGALWTPDGNTVPSYDLAWRRYQSRITTDFIAAQADIVREIARPDQFVTTCMALSRPAFDPRELNKASLDVAAVNPYYAMQDALTMPEAPADAPQLDWTRHSGAWAIHLQGDLTYAALRAPFLVTETNALSIGASHQNFPAFDGQPWMQDPQLAQFGSVYALTGSSSAPSARNPGTTVCTLFSQSARSRTPRTRSTWS